MNIQDRYFLFLDLDGVLADFDRGVRELTGSLPGELESREMWSRLAREPGFYDSLAWMDDGLLLWDFCRKYEPVILTGLPRGKWAEPQKRSWCLRELGKDVEVITCLSREKASIAQARVAQTHPGAIPVLVDDRIRQEPTWLGVGGEFILHKSAEKSIAALENLGYT